MAGGLLPATVNSPLRICSLASGLKASLLNSK